MSADTLTAPPQRATAAPTRGPRPVPKPTPRPTVRAVPDPAAAPAADGVRPFPISRDLYLRMCEAGLFRAEDRVQLLDGRLWEYPPMNRPHWLAVTLLNTLLVKSLPNGWFLTPQLPVVLDDVSEPEPDFAIVRGEPTGIPEKPLPSDTALLIEISDSSLAFDRGRKLRAYAAAGVSEYWILNLNDRSVEVRREPRPAAGDTPAGYGSLATFRGDDRVALVLDGVAAGEFAVGELIPAGEEV